MCEVKYLIVNETFRSSLSNLHFYSINDQKLFHNSLIIIKLWLEFRTTKVDKVIIRIHTVNTLRRTVLTQNYEFRFSKIIREIVQLIYN